MKKPRIYIVFDLETGGFNSEKNPIIEAAFVPVVMNNKNEFSIKKDLSVSSLIKSYSDDLIITEESLEVNKIKRKDIKKKGKELKDVVGDFMNLCESLNPKNPSKTRPILVGHNIDEFDIPFLEKACGIVGVELYRYVSKQTLDTLTLMDFMMAGVGRIDSHSLPNLCKHFKIKNRNAHRAYDDTIANAELFIKISKIMSLKDVRRKYY